MRTTTRVRVETPPAPAPGPAPTAATVAAALSAREASSSAAVPPPPPPLPTMPPLSQRCEQGDHEPHGPRWHVSLHGPASQYLASRSLGHAHRGQALGLVMLRRRCVVPTPQLTEQRAQRCQGETVQSKDITAVLAEVGTRAAG